MISGAAADSGHVPGASSPTHRRSAERRISGALDSAPRRFVIDLSAVTLLLEPAGIQELANDLLRRMSSSLHGCARLTQFSRVVEALT
jgi:hypothetical protein